MNLDLEKMQEELNKFLQQKYGKDVHVGIKVKEILPKDLDAKQKELTRNKEKK